MVDDLFYLRVVRCAHTLPKKNNIVLPPKADTNEQKLMKKR